ncbi:hypothetical protein [Halobacillus litoralis]|uniref:hypothetical protein n=1 Tax=Halobacillus litoralis TaxID=45668 RepID=UPI001CD37E59|nr:hypothetical protein [Halobacillus litoralis]MCA1021539.1 hypothetical protein [Halobacillus litoralis]
MDHQKVIDYLKEHWNEGSTVVSKIDLFDLTKGKKYRFEKSGETDECFYVVNDKGELREYNQSYFKPAVEYIE